MCGWGPKSWHVMSSSHMWHMLHHWPMDRWHMWSHWTCAHVLTCLMWCADMQVKVWVSHLRPRLHHTAPLEQHNHSSHSDLTQIMTTDSLSSAVQWRNHSVASHHTNMCPGLTLIRVIAATYDSISLLRLELVLRTKDLRSHKRCKLRSFYDEISTCTTINSSFAQTSTAQ